MKLTIDIPDKEYNECIERNEWDTLSLGVKLIRAVQNGIPLEDIKEERKTAVWIPTDELEEIYAEMFTCSNCRYSDFMAKYCPQCGAKMDNYSED